MNSKHSKKKYRVLIIFCILFFIQHSFFVTTIAAQNNSILTTYLEVNKSKPVLNAAGDYEQFYQDATAYLKTIEFVIATIKEPSAKKMFYGLEVGFYEQMIDICATLYKSTSDEKYFNQAFLLTEKHRNLLISNTLGFNENGFSDSLKTIEGNYLSRISELEDSLGFEKKQLQFDENRINELELKRDELQEVYEDFLDKNRTENSTKESFNDNVIEILQKERLAKGTNFVTYFYGQNAIFVFVINKSKKDNDKHFFKLTTTKTPQEIEAMIYAVSDNLHSIKEKQAIRDLHDLYKILVEPIEEKLDGNVLQIVADGALSALPFDALLTKFPKDWDYNYQKLSYLVYKYQITFQHSAKIYVNENQDLEKVTNPQLLMIAPSFENVTIDGKKLNNLEQSSAFIKHLQKNWDGNYLENKAASLQNLHQYSNQYQIIHFATHTLVNDETPLDSKIILSKVSKPLLLKDLYRMNLAMDLAVLGSCRTGSGKYQVGIGRVGMAYGFHLAGVPSLVYSLWEVDESATNQLLLLFYANLKAGLSKDSALHQAKIQYLQISNEITADPYYWAGFVLQGETRGFQTNNQNKSWLLIILALLVSGLLIIGFKRRR